METKVITKQLAGSEDLLKGVGSVSQVRSTGTKVIRRLNVSELQGALVVNTIAEMEALVIADLGDTKTVIVNDNGYTYWYNTASFLWERKTKANVSELQGALVVDTIDEMISLSIDNLGDTKAVIVSEANAGGIFHYDSTIDKSTANGGTIINPDQTLANQGDGEGNGCWVRQYSGAVNVKWFGAKGDGVTDDSVAIQAAINSEFKVILSDGVFLVNANLVLRDGSSIKSSKSATIHSGDNCLFSAEGMVSSEVDFTAEARGNERTISVTDASSFTVGEVVRVVSSTNCLNETAGYMQLGRATSTQVSYFAEYCEIYSISGNDITFLSPLSFDQYRLTEDPLVDGGRTCSTIQKLDMMEVTLDGLNVVSFGSGTVIDMTYCKNAVIKNISVNKQKNIGASIFLSDCYLSTISDSIINLDSGTVVKYGDNNPTAYDYYKFNAIKFVGSDSCAIRDCTLNNGTQNIDVSYIDRPCLNISITNNKINNAKFNPVTTHSGSMNTSITNNIMIRCANGVSIRSRGDRVVDNIIIGNKGQHINPYTGSANNGVYSWEGYSVNSTIKNNYIEGFENGVSLYNRSGDITGFPYFRIDISSNSFVYVKYGLHVRVDDTIESDAPSGIVFSGNILKAISANVVRLNSKYIHNTIIDSNTLVDKATSYFFYQNEGDCVGHVITNNNLPRGQEYIVNQKGITNTELLGPNTLFNDGTRAFGNFIAGSRSSAPIRYIFDGTIVSSSGIGNSSILSVDYENISTTVTSFDLKGVNVYMLGNDSDGDILLDTLTGGEDGYRVSFFGSTTISLNSDGNMKLGGATSISLSSDKLVSLICRNDVWYLD